MAFTAQKAVEPVNAREAAHSTEALEADPAFDLRFLTALQSEIGARSFERLLRTCVEDIGLRLERLSQEMARLDMKAARATAHQLLGIFGHVGAVAAADAAQAVLSPEETTVDSVEALMNTGNAAMAKLQSLTGDL